MPHEGRKLLYDAKQAADLIARFTAGKSFEDYVSDPMLSSAVERQFEIIGESLSQLAKVAPHMAARINEYKQIIAFRNALIHGYSAVDDTVVWDIVQTKLPLLSREINALLEGAEPT